MQIEFDPAKRDKTLMERGLDFAHADEVFGGVNVTAEDVKAAHAAHYRCGDQKRPPPPLTPEMRSLRATRYSTAKLRGANRQHNCSADVLGDVPW